MGATTSINEVKPSEVHMDSKHIDKIIRMAAEIDRDNMLENERAHTELGNQFSSLLFMVALRLVRREPYILISSNQNILSRFRFLAERISNTTDVSPGGHPRRPSAKEQIFAHAEGAAQSRSYPCLRP
jgi:hypothetical protein